MCRIQINILKRLCVILVTYQDYSVDLMFVDPCIIVRFIKKIQQDATVYQIFFIPYLSEVQHVSGD